MEKSTSDGRIKSRRAALRTSPILAKLPHESAMIPATLAQPNSKRLKANKAKLANEVPNDVRVAPAGATRTQGPMLVVGIV